MNTQALLTYDRALLPRVIAGMDEAGRGPLAGPVVAACVVMPLDKPVYGIDDSKKLSERKREELYEQILHTCTAYGIGSADCREIDEVNILQATKLAMRRAYAQLETAPQLLLVDAVTGLDLPCETHAIVHGDATSYSIAAASILAKVTRDRMMRAYNETYPIYGFAQNKGYGTKKHIEALAKAGKCPIHRDSFLGHFTLGGGDET